MEQSLEDAIQLEAVSKTIGETLACGDAAVMDAVLNRNSNPVKIQVTFVYNGEIF